MALQEELKEQGNFLFKYRGYLPLILLVFGLLLIIYQAYTFDGKESTIHSNILQLSAFAVGIIGLLVRVFTIGYTPKHTSGRNIKGQVAKVLNTTGLYSIIRNPLYLGNYLMWLSIAMLTKNIWFVSLFSLAFWIYYERIVYAEEYFLRNKFGDIYLNWTKITPPFLPTHVRYKKPEISFSWKKVFRMEKTGLFVLFFVFFMFDLIGKSVNNRILLIEGNWLMIGTIASAILYIILKVLLKYTDYLDEKDR